MTIEYETAALKAALLAASTEKHRSHIAGVYIDAAGFIVATDGHILVATRCQPCEKSFFIPTETLKAGLSANGRMPTIALRPDAVGALAYEPSTLEFPNWRVVMPRELSGDHAEFDCNLLGRLGKIAKVLGGGHARLHLNGKNAAGGTFTARTDCFGAVIPYRMPKDGASWADTIAGTA